jgi:hypothetical protein
LYPFSFQSCRRINQTKFSLFFKKRAADAFDFHGAVGAPRNSYSLGFTVTVETGGYAYAADHSSGKHSAHRPHVTTRMRLLPELCRDRVLTKPLHNDEQVTAWNLQRHANKG